MASVDMCEHDWPGSGCKECFPPISDDIKNIILSGLGPLELAQIQSGKESLEYFCIRGRAVANIIKNLLEGLVWLPIETAPTDDSEFFVGAWDGEQLWNEDYTSFKWVGEPTWLQAFSHHENTDGPHITRGWNHRNGPLKVRATHWCRGPSRPPKCTEPVLIEKN